MQSGGVDSQVLAEQSEARMGGRKLPMLAFQCPESEGGSRSVACPRGPNEAEKPQRTGLTSLCGCPDQRPRGAEVGCLCRW